MIHHSIRFTFRPDVTAEQREQVLESLRHQGRSIPEVRSFIVGRDHGGEYEWGATYLIEDLDSYWNYLIHPTHLHTDRIGWPLLDQFLSFDITDDLDPELGNKIATLHQRRFNEYPELANIINDQYSQGS
ncbi:Dabb family protein [Sciscionella sediminilitoris]|uniref:Dabb family protein n=1 Tax=Sciscionella sediminilitoris TaxID=1445613 RepID=UPI0004DF1B68|nr:Dabb family protein [Sciscionella sp. SE31]